VLVSGEGAGGNGARSGVTKTTRIEASKPEDKGLSYNRVGNFRRGETVDFGAELWWIKRDSVR